MINTCTYLLSIKPEPVLPFQPLQTSKYGEIIGFISGKNGLKYKLLINSHYH